VGKITGYSPIKKKGHGSTVPLSDMKFVWNLSENIGELHLSV
jgi:hypothetical protein